MNMKIPTNVVVCLETIKEVSNLGVLPKGALTWMLNKVGIIKASGVPTGGEESDPDKTMKRVMQVVIGFVAGGIGLGVIALIFILKKRFPV